MLIYFSRYRKKAAKYMRGQVRQKMVEGATKVLARRGLHATAFSEVLAVTGASRGSIYHHFPGGKAELIEAVLDDYGSDTDDALQALHGQPLMAVVRGALALWRERLEGDGCEAGCPVAAVSVAADSPRLESECRSIFDQWTVTLAEGAGHVHAGGDPGRHGAGAGAGRHRALRHHGAAGHRLRPATGGVTRPAPGLAREQAGRRWRARSAQKPAARAIRRRAVALFFMRLL